jgi:CheY-like chemotaxis protein
MQFAAAISGLGAIEILGPLAVVATSDEATAMARRYIHLSAAQRPAKLFTSLNKAQKWLNAQLPRTFRGDARILVVDDNQGVLREAVELLTGFGYQVIAASSGTEALALLERDDSIDLLFTDVVMPGELAGRALAAKAVEMRPDLKVLFVSGYFEGSLVEKDQLETDVQFLAKPYRKKQLAQKIEEVLSAAT